MHSAGFEHRWKQMDELINEGVCPYLYKIAIAKKIDLRHRERIESEREREREIGSLDVGKRPFQVFRKC